MVRSVFIRLAITTLLCGVACPSRGEEIYAVTSTSTLIRFDSATPGNITTVGTITGITTGTLHSIDFRRATGQLFALSYELNTDVAQLYTIDRNSAIAAAVGAPIILTGTNSASRISIDVDPVNDVIRAVSAGTATSTNFRLNPITGAIVAQDTNLAYAAGDPNNGVQPYVASIAYSNPSPAGPVTTLYGYDFGLDALVRIGSPGGSPTSPNTGQIFTVSGSGSTTLFNTIGFDISNTTAYLGANVLGLDEHLLTINLSNGATTDLGVIGGGLEVIDIAVSIAAVPEPISLALGGGLVVAAAFAAYRFRQRRRQHLDAVLEEET